MKYIILLISLSFAQVIAPIGFGEKELAEIDTSNAIITCLVNHPKGYNCDYGKTTSESYEHMLQRIDSEYDRLHPRERVVTVGDYFDYAEECYNDSTEDYYIRVLDSAEIIYYRHPKPTFEGFTEWLKEK